MSWSNIQRVNTVNAADPSTSTTITITATGAGRLILVIKQGGQGASRPITSITGSSETWVDAGNDVDSAGNNLDYQYVLSSVGADTSYTVNYASETGGAVAITVMEFAYTSGPIAFDTQDRINDTATDENPPGLALTLTGTNDVLVQVICMQTDPTAISGAYAANYDRPRFGYATGYALNQASASAPTWTALADGHPKLKMAMAFKESAGGGALPFITTMDARRM